MRNIMDIIWRQKLSEKTYEIFESLLATSVLGEKAVFSDVGTAFSSLSTKNDFITS